MKKVIKVSVIVPVYNVEKYLRQCLESLVNQTLREMEIICVNDGSTDSSPQIIEEYMRKDSRVRMISKENTGYGHSMNLGIDSSTGEYIGIVEADDFVNPEMFEELYRLASENQADMVKSDFYYYLDKRSRKAGKIAKNKCFKVFNVKDDNTILKMMPSIWSAIYKRDGNNVVCDIPITITQATLGAELEIPMVDGSKEKYKIPEGTQTGTKFVIRGKGFKSINSSSTGNFVFNVIVQTPKKLTKEQRDLLVELAKSMNEQPPIKKRGIFG